MSRCAWACVLGLLLVGCSIKAAAPPPTPNLPEQNLLESGAVLDVVDATDEKVCSQHPGLKDFCVTGFRTAFRAGTERVLSRFFRASGSGPAYHAKFRLVDFSHSPTSGAGGNVGPSVQVALRWQFSISRPDGTIVIDLAETTTGPIQLIDVGASQTVIAALDNAVLERIAKALGEARGKLELAAEPSDKGKGDAGHTAAGGPDGVSGFKFGATLRAVEQVCTESGQTWSSENDAFTCTKMPWSLPVEGTAHFKFCATKLCRIEIVGQEDAEGKDSLRATLKLHKLLVEKYGYPTENRQAIPTECAENAVPCLVGGTATLDYEWKFAAKKSITLVTKKEEQGVRMRLVYDQDGESRTRGL